MNSDNYTTFESLLDKSGDVNTAITRRDEFKTFPIYKKILEQSKDLDVFNGIRINERINFIVHNMKIQFCLKCGKPYIEFPKSQKTYSLCSHNKKHNVDQKMVIHSRIDEANKQFISSLTNKKLILAQIEFDIKLNELLKKNENYAFVISNKFKDFYHDCVVKTSELIPFDVNDFNFRERIYLLSNNIAQIPTCCYCGKPVQFINRVVGYAKSCPSCKYQKNADTRSIKLNNQILQVISSDRYEIISIPKLVNFEPLVIKCRKCGSISEHFIKNGRLQHINENTLLCKKCEIPKSKGEEDVYNFIRTITTDKIIHGVGGRKTIYPRELDIYVPSKKLAIEYDGLYWHSEAHGANRNSQLEKTLLCDEKHIQLIHIFEDEWLQKQDIVKSRLSNLFGVYDNVVFARKCEIRLVDSKTSQSFQNENHIQGSCKSKISLGLFFNNELISLMTFGKCRFDKKHEWELLRFCNKLGYHIPGAAGKLLKYFERNNNPKSLVSYADRRWSVGKLYEALGFTLTHKSPPNYWYLYNNDFEQRLNRINFQKHKLKNKLDKFDSNKSEYENMRDNGYCRIFDCGNLVYEKIY